jgi:DNA-binding NarL/FixJ family response regulator
MRAMKILIVDDHAVVRSGLRQFLSGVENSIAVGEAGTGMEAISLAVGQDWDVVLLDVGLPDLNGLEVLKRIKRESPDLPVLIFSMFAEDDYAMPALQAGAAGFLPKDSTPEEIVEAIRRTSKGGKYLSPHLAERLLNGSAAAGRKLPHDSLSERESEVMMMLSRGVSLTQIADRLHLSPKTVTTYRTRILEKLQLESNAELARYVVKHKLDAL